MSLHHEYFHSAGNACCMLREPPLLTPAAPAFHRPLNHTGPSARIHQIIFHHRAMSDGLKMLPALLEKLLGELRWER
ncbi:hypothetical protein QQF64_029761 [Cirrhinus molitorella]|uniref:Uncharacterized protein n=1 Tax=Cirrhinus molitorella TaxID=172907 RepID=A0ABR3N1Q8_9TELE